MSSLYTVILVIGFCSSFVISESKHRFISIPAVKQRISLSSNLTINCSTNDANASTAVYFKRRSRQTTWKLLKPGNDHIIQVSPQVYTLLNVARQHKGQYQCRAWKGINGTLISWPLHVGKIIVTKGAISKKTYGSKNQGRNSGLKTTKKDKKSKRKPISAKHSKRRRLHLKKAAKKQGKKRLGSKKNKRKRPGSKKRGKKRPSAKPLARKRPASKKGGKKLSSVKKSGKRRSGGKKGGKNTKKTKKEVEKQQPKSSIKLKTRQTKINATVGLNLYINCVAKYKPTNPKPSFTIAWYKDNTSIRKPFSPPNMIIVTKNKMNKRKVHSLLRITRFQTAHKGKYVCKAIYSNGTIADSLTIQVTPKS